MSDADAPLPDPGSSGVDPVADLVARAILALEIDGESAAEAILVSDERHADAARVRLQALRQSGMLRDPADHVPERIGPFRILERLGRGGMGEVYLAEQREPLQRRVALKVIRRDMGTREVLARFALERQALALLDHPNIATIHEAGETSDGRPYLAIEYVAGVPITNYCDERELDTEARVELFATVCDAVQYAHQRGIVHRDLKPSNILVADQDGRPWPKIIDLGVAKSTQRRPAGSTLHTEIGRPLGTPEYMSPEQAANRVDIDTRTDVYSLGVILYELLTGQLPIDSARLRNAGPAEMERILQREEPPTPSTKISSLGAASADVAGRRRTDPTALRRQLRGDLDWITMRALERDRNRRYPMAAAIASDLRRHLAFEPVSAGPPSGLYRMSRFARRYRGATIATFAIVLAMVTGLAISVSAWRTAHDAQQREATARGDAEQALAVALRAADELLVQVGGDRLRRFPGLAAERRRLLESGLAFCRSVMRKATVGPRQQTSTGLVQARIAWFLLELDRSAESLAVLDGIAVPDDGSDAALELALAIENVRGSVCLASDDDTGAIAAHRRALDFARQRLSRAPDDVELQDQEGVCVGRLAALLLETAPEDAETAAVVARARAATQRAVDRDGPPTQHLPILLRNWAVEASHEIQRGHWADVRPLVDELETQLRRLLASDPDDLVLMEDLAPALALRARAMLAVGDYGAAERDARESLRIRQQLAAELPGDPTSIAALASAHMTVAESLFPGFLYSASLEQLRSAVELRQQLVDRDPDAAKPRIELSASLAKLALVSADWHALKPDLDLGEAEDAARRAVDLVEDVLATAGNDQTLTTRQISEPGFAYGRIAEALGHFDEAASSYERVLAHVEAQRTARPELVGTHVTAQMLLATIGRLRNRMGDFAAAREALQRSIAVEDALRARGIVYRNSEQRLTVTLMLLAQACVATDDLADARSAVRRATELAPTLQVQRREAAAVLVSIALRTEDPTARQQVLREALDEALAAQEILRTQHRGPTAVPSLSYRLTEYQVLGQLAEVNRHLLDPVALELTLREQLEIAELVCEERGTARDRERLTAVFDALIDAAQARGDRVEHDRLVEERAAAIAR